jgi:uncharacterized membrane protein (DUF4010 family)
MIDDLHMFLETIDQQYLGVLLALSLGIFIGIERERSDKMAGVRTFALISLTGSIMAIIGEILLITSGVTFIVVFSALMALKDISTENDLGLSLTTSAALLSTYLSGVMAGNGNMLLASTTAIIIAALLVSKDSLHEFAGGITKKEFFSAMELLAISIVVYPFIPEDNLGPWNSIDLQLVWLLIVAVSGLGFFNYILVKKYQEKGFIATGFFGGLVNSTAVIGTITDRVSEDKAPTTLAVSAILLANSAMAIRNAVIAGAFLPSLIVVITVPLIVVSLSGIVISLIIGDFNSEIVPADLESPFSLKNAFVFGGLFLVILVISASTTEYLGEGGFYVTMFFAGLVSSGTATTTAVTLVSTSQVSAFSGSIGVLIGTGASILAKIFLVASVQRSLAKPVILWSLVILILGFISSSLTYLIVI